MMYVFVKVYVYVFCKTTLSRFSPANNGTAVDSSSHYIRFGEIYQPLHGFEEKTLWVIGLIQFMSDSVGTSLFRH